MILVSACLLGECCKYSGGHNRSQAVIDYLQGHEYLTICPEVFGGLPTPRPPAEIVGGTAKDIIDGRAQIYNNQGQDVTASFLADAFKVAKMASEYQAKAAILQDRSPSCGVNKVYDGSFTGCLKPGMGVTALLLQDLGLKLFVEEDLLS